MGFRINTVLRSKSLFKKYIDISISIWKWNLISRFIKVPMCKSSSNMPRLSGLHVKVLFLEAAALKLLENLFVVLHNLVVAKWVHVLQTQSGTTEFKKK